MARLPRPVRIALALDLALVVAEGLFHPPWLPLGGNHCAQLGICLGVAVLICEMLDDDDEGPGSRVRVRARSEEREQRK